MNNSQEMEEFSRLVRELNNNIQGLGGSFNTLRRSSEDFGNQIDRNADQVSAETDIRNSEIKARQESDRRELQEKQKREQAWRDAVYSSQTALRNFTSAFKSNEEGIGKYSSSITSAGDAAFQAGKSFGILGGALGLVIKAFTMLVGASLKISENALKATDSLSKIGSAGQFTSEEVRKFGTAAGYTSERLDKLTKPMQSLGSGLITLGTTAAGGMRAFAKIAAVGDETYAKYQKLGISQEELTQAQADYVKLYSSSGMMLNKPIKELQKNSLEYIDRLMELSALTGEDIETIKKRNSEALSEIQTKIQMNLLDQEILALQKKQATTVLSDEETQRLKLLEKRKESTEKVLQFAENTFKSPELRKAIANAMSGFITPEVTGLQNMGVPIMEMVERLKNTGEDVSEELAESVVKNLDRVTGLYGATSGQLSDEVRKAFMMFPQLYDAAAQYRTKGFQQMEAEARENRERVEQEGDAAQQVRVEMLTAERNLKIGFENLVTRGTSLFNVFGILAEAIKKLNGVIRSLPFMGGDEDDDKSEAQLAAERSDRQHAAVKVNRFGYGQTESDKQRLAELDETAMPYRRAQEYNAALEGTGYTYTEDGRLLNPEGQLTFGKDLPEDVKKKYDEVYFRRNPNAKPTPVTKKAKGGTVKPGELAIVGDGGPELIQGPGTVTSVQDTASILRGMSQGFSTSTIRSQQILNERKMREIMEEKEKELETLTSFNKSIGFLTESTIKLSDVFYEFEEKLRSIFGTEEFEEDSTGKKLSPIERMRQKLEDIFTGGGGGTVDKTPLPPGISGLLEQISRGEGTSDAQAKAHGFSSGYDVSLEYGRLGGGTDKPLSQMTLGEVKEYQQRMLNDPKNRHNSSAIGKYQIVNKTLVALQRQLGLGDDVLFDKKTQDMMAEALLKRRGIKKYLSGEMSASRLQHNIAQEWASIADVTGNSFYGQRVGTSGSELMAALSGINEKSTAYTDVASSDSKAALMKPDEKTTTSTTPTQPVVTTTTTTTLETAQVLSMNTQMMDTLSTKLDTLISKMGESIAVQEKIQRQSA